MAEDIKNVLCCTICSGDFNIETEGGSQGYIGILPVQFCPSCKTGIFDYADQNTKYAFTTAYRCAIEMHCRHKPDPVNLEEEMEVAWETFEEEMRK